MCVHVTYDFECYDYEHKKWNGCFCRMKWFHCCFCIRNRYNAFFLVDLLLLLRMQNSALQSRNSWASFISRTFCFLINFLNLQSHWCRLLEYLTQSSRTVIQFFPMTICARTSISKYTWHTPARTQAICYFGLIYFLYQALNIFSSLRLNLHTLDNIIWTIFRHGKIVHFTWEFHSLFCAKGMPITYMFESSRCCCCCLNAQVWWHFLQLNEQPLIVWLILF